MHYAKTLNKSVELESITTWCNKILINRNISNLNRATSLYMEQKLYHFFRQRNKAIDDLSSFTTFYKRDAGGNHFSNARYRREALENLGAFTTFMKKNKPFNEAAPSIGKRSSRHSREALLDSLGKEFFRTCNVLPFNCTHLPMVHAKQKGFKNFFTP